MAENQVNMAEKREKDGSQVKFRCWRERLKERKKGKY